MQPLIDRGRSGFTISTEHMDQALSVEVKKSTFGHQMKVLWRCKVDKISKVTYLSSVEVFFLCAKSAHVTYSAYKKTEFSKHP